MLRNVEAFRDWATRPGVPTILRQEIAVWIMGLDTASYRWPSFPDTGLSDLPDSEVRRAEIKGVQIVYEVLFHPFEEIVDLMYVDYA